MTQRKFLAWSLSAALVLAPAATALAAVAPDAPTAPEAAIAPAQPSVAAAATPQPPAAQAAPDATATAAAAASPVSPVAAAVASGPAAETPSAAVAPQAASPSAAVESVPLGLPTETLVKPGPPKPEAPASRFKGGNFLLGFAGGALLGGALAFLFGSTDATGKIDYDKAKVLTPLTAVGAGLLGGGLAFWLGGYSPQEAKPPAVEGWAPRPALGLQASLRF